MKNTPPATASIYAYGVEYENTDKSSILRSTPDGHMLVSNGPIEAEDQLSSDSGVEQVFSFDYASGETLNRVKTINSSEWVNVKNLGRLTVRGKFDGNGSTVFKVKALVTRSASPDTLVSVDTLTSNFSGTEDDLVRNLDILDVSWVQVTETTPSSDGNSRSAFLFAS